MVPRLEQLLANLLHVRRDGDKVALAEPDEHVPVAEPLVRHDVAVARLERELDRVLRVVEVEQKQRLVVYEQADRVLSSATLVRLFLTKGYRGKKYAFA